MYHKYGIISIIEIIITVFNYYISIFLLLLLCKDFEIYLLLMSVNK